MSMIYARIKNDDLISTFPNVEIVLRMFLPMIVTNRTGQRSFLKLIGILIKKELCSHAARVIFMSVESDVLES